MKQQSLLNHVLDAPVTVLYGRSGLGKTSLLRAGLFPLLRERTNFLPVYVRFELKPGAAPLSRQLHQSVRDSIRADVPDAMLPSDEESLWEYLHRADFELWSARNYPLTPVIVLDQFEELFTLGERVPDLVRAFRNDLGDLAENRIPADLAARIEDDEAVAERFNLRSRNYKLLISLREDFLPDLEGVVPAHSRAGTLAGAAASLAGRRSIRCGAQTGCAPDDGRAGAPGGGHHRRRGPPPRPRYRKEPTAIVLVMTLGLRKWNLRCSACFAASSTRSGSGAGSRSFDEQLVEDAKRDILSNYYSSCVRDLPPRVAEFIESELITEKGFRNSYAREDAVPSRLTEDELARLISSRLLRLEERYGAQRIELTHDVLTGVVREHRDRRRAEEERAAGGAGGERGAATASPAQRRRSSRPRSNAGKPN